MKFANFNDKIQVLTVSAPPRALEANVLHDAKIANEMITFKKITKKKDNSELQIAEVLVAVDGYKPFKASLISQSPDDFKSKKVNDIVSIFIKETDGYRNAEI